MAMGKRARTKKRDSLPPIISRREEVRPTSFRSLTVYDTELIEENDWLRIQQEKFHNGI